MNEYCFGDGACLCQLSENRLQRKFQCDKICQAKQCANFWLCCSYAPQRIFDCHNKVCMNCDILFAGKLNVNCVENIKCPVCMETTSELVEFQQCSHSVCLQCFANISFDCKANVKQNLSASNIHPTIQAQIVCEDEYEIEDHNNTNDNDNLVDFSKISNGICPICLQPPIQHHINKSTNN